VRSLAQKTVIAAALVWLARRVLRRVTGLAVIAAVLIAGASFAGEHGVDVDAVRQTVSCDIAALRDAVPPAAPSSDAAESRSGERAAEPGPSLPQRLAACHAQVPAASSRSAR